MANPTEDPMSGDPMTGAKQVAIIEHSDETLRVVERINELAIELAGAKSENSKQAKEQLINIATQVGLMETVKVTGADGETRICKSDELMLAISDYKSHPDNFEALKSLNNTLYHHTIEKIAQTGITEGQQEARAAQDAYLKFYSKLVRATETNNFVKARGRKPNRVEQAIIGADVLVYRYAMAFVIKHHSNLAWVMQRFEDYILRSPRRLLDILMENRGGERDQNQRHNQDQHRARNANPAQPDFPALPA